MNRLLALLLSMLVFNAVTTAQVAINTDGSNPDPSAGLEVKFTNKGFLPPRLSTIQRDAIPAPAAGLIIYNTTLNRLEYNAGTWAPLLSPTSGWSLTGNAGIVNGVNFIGTTDNHPLEFRVNNFIAGKLDHINSNTSFGINTLIFNTAGAANVAFGDGSLQFNTSGERNVALGADNLNSNTTGYRNSSVGVSALAYNTTGYYNTVSGNASMYRNNSGSYNSAFGSDCLYNNQSGNYNTAVGSESLYLNFNGMNNLAAGYQALYNSTGNLNSALGFMASYSTTTGFQNTSAGAYSLVNNTTGSYHTAIGYNTGPNAGNLANTTTLGIDATGTATDQVRIGNVFVNSIGGYANWTNISDGRYKTEVRENVPGLAFISQLRPVTYRLDRNRINEQIGIKNSYQGEPFSQAITGFIAQEVESLAQKLGFEFSGVDAPKNDKDVYGLRYSDFVVPLVKAVQELDEKNQQLEKNNRELLKRIELLEAKIGSGK